MKKQGTSCIFLNPQNEILLLLRDDKPAISFPNCWDIPGGRLEEGETPLECIIREMQEELERDVTNTTLFTKTEFTDRIEHTFWIRADFDAATAPLHEGQRIQWFSEEEIGALPTKMAFESDTIVGQFFRALRAGQLE